MLLLRNKSSVRVLMAFLSRDESSVRVLMTFLSRDESSARVLMTFLSRNESSARVLMAFLSRNEKKEWRVVSRSDWNPTDLRHATLRSLEKQYVVDVVNNVRALSERSTIVSTKVCDWKFSLAGTPTVWKFKYGL